MPYVQRNKDGEIVALWKERHESAMEFLPPSDPAVHAFVEAGQADGADGFSLASDLQMVRVIEDVIDLLIAKQVIVLTDLPLAVQQKLLRQRARRERLLKDVSVIDEEEKGLF